MRFVIYVTTKALEMDEAESRVYRGVMADDLLNWLTGEGERPDWLESVNGVDPA